MAATAQELLTRIEALKRTVETKSAERQRLLGKDEELRRSLKSLIGTDDVTKAKALLETMRAEAVTLQADITRVLSELEGKYA